MSSKQKLEPLYTCVDSEMLSRLSFIETYIIDQWSSAERCSVLISDVDVNIWKLHELRLSISFNDQLIFINPDSLLYVMFKDGKLLFNADGVNYILKNAYWIFQSTFIPIVDYLNLVNVLDSNYFSIAAINNAQKNKKK